MTRQDREGYKYEVGINWEVLVHLPMLSRRQHCNDKAGKEGVLSLGMVKVEMEKGEEDEKLGMI